MDWRISTDTAAPEQGAASRSAIAHSYGALLIALAAGALGFISPPLSILALAVLAARALMRSESVRIDFLSLVGPIVAALIVGGFAGFAGGMGVLFVWRLAADTRWSTSEAARLAAAAGRPVETTLKSLAHAWLTPFYALTLVAFTAPHMIAGLPLDLPHVPFWVPLGAGIIAAGALFDWGLRRAADWRLGELAGAPAAHLLAHHVMFIAAFGAGLDFSAGVVAMIAWRLAHAAPLALPERLVRAAA